MGMEKGGAIIGPCPTPHPPHIGMETCKSRIRTHKAHKLRHEIKRKAQVGDGHWSQVAVSKCHLLWRIRPRDLGKAIAGIETHPIVPHSDKFKILAHFHSSDELALCSAGWPFTVVPAVRNCRAPIHIFTFVFFHSGFRRYCDRQ